MRHTTVFCLLPLLASALNITYPNTNAIVDINKSWNITWTSTASDPEFVRISLLRVGVSTTADINTVAYNASTAQQKFDVPAYNISLPSNITAEGLIGWTVNITDLTTFPYTNIAQGDIFSLSRGNTTSNQTTSVVGSPASTSSVVAAATVTSSGLAEQGISKPGGHTAAVVLVAAMAVLL